MPVPGKHDNHDLLSRALSGDPNAWFALVDAYASLVFGTALRVGLTREQAADVSQAVWTTLFERGRTIRDAEALPRWLVVTTRRRALRERMGAVPETVALDAALQEGVPSVATLLEREQEAELVRDALRELPDRCRVLLTRLFEEDRPDYAQVSADLSVPIGSIGPTRARCLAKLYLLLRTRGMEP